MRFTDIPTKPSPTATWLKRITAHHKAIADFGQRHERAGVARHGK